MPERPTGRQLLRDAKAKVPALDPLEVNQILKGPDQVVLVDVRENDEWQQGYIKGAIHVPRSHFEMRIDERLPDLEAPIIIYCAGGNRSALAAITLEELGYTDVRHMSGGIGLWRQEGLPVETPRNWTRDQLDRYSRHFVLPEVGEEGQTRISNGKVLVVGAGGLGAPAIYYLGAAGVGTIGIVDFDAVEQNNLQRQIIHSTSRIGMNKAESAAATINDLNPDVAVKLWTERLTRDNVDGIVSDFDVVIDATDNFDTRYLLNESAYKHDKPYIYGSIYRFEGYASVFWPEKGGPCYRCLHPEAPPEHLAPT
jgi:molybdopterin/thiamine biosynthesis adenylyltransferase/rhodanese-related sulfurtransferase